MRMQALLLLVAGVAAVVVLAFVAFLLFLRRPANGQADGVPPDVSAPATERPGAEPSNAGSGSARIAPRVASGESPAAEPAGQSAAVRAVVARFADANIPVEERRSELEVLARKNDRQAVEVLQALGDERTYFNWLAVEKLGEIAHPESREARVRYLGGKLKAADPRLLCAALRALTRLQGDAAVPALAEVIRSNRARSDGHEDMVCSAAVKALDGAVSPVAVPILREELERSGDKGWSLEYGSAVVAALAHIGNRDAQAAAAAYAERLAGQLPADPMAREYYLKKIAEAREVAGPAGRN